MVKDLMDNIHELERETRDIKTKQYIAGDNWILHRNSRLFYRDTTLKYKVIFRPEINADYIAILKLLRSDDRYTQSVIYPDKDINGVWYVYSDPFPGVPGQVELHVFSTVRGELTVQQI